MLTVIEPCNLAWVQANATGNSSSDHTSSPNAVSTLPKDTKLWPGELVDKLIAAINELGPLEATPQAMLELVDWPGLTEDDTARFIQV